MAGPQSWVNRKSKYREKITKMVIKTAGEVFFLLNEGLDDFYLYIWSFDM